MPTSEEGWYEAGIRRMSADVPLIQRLGYGLGAVGLHGLILMVCLIGLEGEGLDMRTAVAADEIAIYVETIVPAAAEEEKPAPAPVPTPVPTQTPAPPPEPSQERELEPEAVEDIVQPDDTNDVEEPPLPLTEEADVVLPRARVKPVALVAKPTPPQKQLSQQPVKSAPVQVRKASLQVQQQTKAESRKGWMKPSFPAYLKNPPPRYPASARKRRLEGVVYLQVQVSAQGTVQEIKIQSSCGHHQLDREAVKTVRTWRFIPAKRNGVAQAGEVIVPVRFRLK